jgi:uncharacterized protein (DUF952 family)
MALFHITTRAAWNEARTAGVYRPPSLASEGFIHFSREDQWLRTADRFFRGQRDLVLVSVRADRVRARLVEEPADGELFPHLYGELNLDAVVDVYDLPVAPDGTIGIPEALKPA